MDPLHRSDLGALPLISRVISVSLQRDNRTAVTLKFYFLLYEMVSQNLRPSFWTNLIHVLYHFREVCAD